MAELFVELWVRSMEAWVLISESKMKNTCILIYRVYRWVWHKFSPFPLWSRTGCTISEPDPNSAPACGVSGAHTFPAGLKRRVSKTPVWACCSVQRAYLCVFLHFLYENTSHSVNTQIYLNAVSTLSLWQFINASYQITQQCFLSFGFFMQLSARHLTVWMRVDLR